MAYDDGWMKGAACRSVPNDDLFFVHPMTVELTRPAKEICAACPVRRTCLQYAIAHSIRHGIWGGRTPRERRLIPGGVRREIRRWWFYKHPNAKMLAHHYGMYLPSQKRKEVS